VDVFVRCLSPVHALVAHCRDGTGPPRTYSYRMAGTRSHPMAGARPDLPAASTLTTPERRSYTEALTVFEPARLAWNGWRLIARRPPVSRTVVLLPGSGGADGSTAPLRAYLRSLGHDAHGWGLGRNRGDVDGSVELLRERLEEWRDAGSLPVVVIGWSHGGVIARELARNFPELVGRVITFGTPVVGGAKYTALAHRYRRQGVDLDEQELEVARRAELPAHIPITAIYSRRDGVVAWQACVDRINPHAEHIEVNATHLGLGLHHEVWRIVADRLALPDGLVHSTRR
jgi:alpha/beta superfamily hydrolase